MSVQVVAVQMAVIFNMLLIGYILAQKSKLSEGTRGELSYLIANVTNPALMMTGALNRSQDIPFSNLWIMAGLSLGIDAVLIALAFIMGPLLRAQRKEWNFYNLLTAFGNTGMIGIPVAAAVLGSASLIYMAVFNVFYMLLMYTYGSFVLDREAGEKSSASAGIGSAVNPGSVMAVLTILVFVMKLSVPQVLSDTVVYVGNTTCFLSIMLIGASMAGQPLRTVFTNGRLYLFTFVRLLLLPAAASLVLKGLIDDRLLVSVCVFILSVPAANMPAIMAMQRGVESELLTQGIILTTLASLVTITIVAAIL